MKTLKTNLLLCFLSITTLLITSCSSDDTDAVETPQQTTPNYTVTNSGASAYVFNSNILTDSSNPDLTLKRGKTYTFAINTPGHPFLIKSSQTTGTENLYNNGVTNNGAVSGTLTFVVPETAPDTLFYVCEFHGVMTGTITITD